MEKNISLDQALALYHQPLMDLLYQAATIHRQYHAPNQIQVSTLISIKTGACPEDCSYCPQSARYQTDIQKHRLMELEQVVDLAKEAIAKGSSRICMGAAWKNIPAGKDFDRVLEMVRTLNQMKVEVCCTLGMLTQDQAQALSEAGLYAYNHNLDTSEEYYKNIISTRTYQDRLDTIENVRKTNITICSGGIIGMGESLEDRLQMLLTLASLSPQPESVPINALIAIKGTPLENQQPVSPWEMIRMVAVARILLPKTQVRLSAGRHLMSAQTQALCFFAGANSIFSGEKLLTAPNADPNSDEALFEAMGLTPMKAFVHRKKEQEMI